MLTESKPNPASQPPTRFVARSNCQSSSRDTYPRVVPMVCSVVSARRPLRSFDQAVNTLELPAVVGNEFLNSRSDALRTIRSSVPFLVADRLQHRQRGFPGRAKLGDHVRSCVIR